MVDGDRRFAAFNRPFLDIYEFEQIICVSSLKEGVWEADDRSEAPAISSDANTEIEVLTRDTILRVAERAAALRAL